MNKLLRRSLLGLALALPMAAALWPMTLECDSGETREASACRQKVSSLAAAARRGQHQETVLSEREVNAHLAELLERNPQARQPKGLAVAIEDLRLRAEEGRAVLAIQGRLVGVGFQVALATEGCGAAQPCPGTFRQVRVGHLPLIPPFKWLVQRRLDRLTRGLTPERATLQGLRQLEVEEGRLRLVVGPA